MIFVCPDGEKSWYWDSPLHAESQFETFISGELPAWIDARYPTIAAREGRAITGLSMAATAPCGMPCVTPMSSAPPDRHPEGSISGPSPIRGR